MRPLAPASRHTLAAAISTANPRLANNPPWAHAARWWPKKSCWRPHRHGELWEGEAGGDGGPIKTLNKCGSKRVSQLHGTVEKGTPAKGPLYDLSNALSLSSALGKMTLALWWASTRTGSFALPPCTSIAGVRVRGRGWRARSMCQLEPRGWYEFHHSGQIPSSCLCGHEARRTNAIR